MTAGVIWCCTAGLNCQIPGPLKRKGLPHVRRGLAAENLRLAFCSDPAVPSIPPPQSRGLKSAHTSHVYVHTYMHTTTKKKKKFLITESLLPSTGAWSTDNTEGSWSKMAKQPSTNSGAGKSDYSVVLFFLAVFSTLWKLEMLGETSASELKNR